MAEKRRAFHNLDGVLRDLASCRRAGPEGDGEAYARWTAFVDNVEYATEELGGDDGDAEDGDSDVEAELDSVFGEGRDAGSSGAGGPAEGSDHRRSPASLLDAVLDGLAGEERAQAQLELDALRRDVLAGTLALSGGRRKVSGGKK